MTVKVVALGRPGSGKTTAVLHIIDLAERRNYPTLRLKEYDILYEMFRDKDNAENKKFRPTAYGGFEITDFSVLDTSLKKLEEKIQGEGYDGDRRLITIELARDDYRKALGKFSRNFLQDSYFLFVEADVETCVERIHNRLTIPPRPDHHFVPDHIIRTHYNVDSWQYMAYDFKSEYNIRKQVLAYRNTDSYRTFIAKVSEFAELIFKEEFLRKNSEPPRKDPKVLSTAGVPSW